MRTSSGTTPTPQPSATMREDGLVAVDLGVDLGAGALLLEPGVDALPLEAAPREDHGQAVPVAAAELRAPRELRVGRWAR